MTGVRVHIDPDTEFYPQVAMSMRGEDFVRWGQEYLDSRPDGWYVEVPAEVVARYTSAELEWKAAQAEMASYVTERCPQCQEPGHDTCSMTPGCPCCDDTIAKLRE